MPHTHLLSVIRKVANILSLFRPIGPDIQPGDFITETWFMALLISMVTVMVLLFGAMLLVRRRQMLAKKAIPSSRSNGGVLTTPIGSKHETPLWMDKEALPEYASTLPDYGKLNQDYQRPNYCSLNGAVGGNSGINVHANPLHQKEYARPDRLEYGSEKNYSVNFSGLTDLGRERKMKDYCSMQVQDYASPNLDSNRSQVADYAEVDHNIAQNTGATSPAPYATTTLVTGNRRIGNSMVSTYGDG